MSASPAPLLLLLLTAPLAATDALAGPVIVEAGRNPEFITTITGVSELSGLSWCKEDLYYGVSDSQPGIFPLHLTIDPATGVLTAVTPGEMIKVTSTLTDFEDIACDPGGKVRFYVSTERPPAIACFSIAGEPKAVPALPPVFQQARFNKAMEALTRDPETGHLWTANEDTLTIDGEPSATDHGGLVRLQELYGQGRPLRQFAWATDNPGVKIGSGSAGVVALCALPGGHLLVMERLVAGFHLEMRIYLATIGEAATDTIKLETLNGAKITPVQKTLLYSRNTGLTNFEGLAAGPVLKDGSQSLIAVADNGSGDRHTFLSLRIITK